jgi:beta-N-acetylhexosaminidase
LKTLRQQIGQMLIMGFSGTEINEHSPITKWLTTDGLGGVILFDIDLLQKGQAKNLVNQEQIRLLNTQLKQCAQVDDYKEEKLFPFIAIDYEGGIVDRLSQIDGCLKTKKPCELALLNDEDLKVEARTMAETLQSLGFNLNFAPVVDLKLNEERGIIGKLGRSFSAEPSQVARVAKVFIETFSEHGITCCYKHFPGHGSAISDSHQGCVDVTETFQDQELEPYSLLLKHCETPTMIMTAHVINRKLDATGVAATLSHPILNGLLREQLGFNGVIISDDLQMQAISNHYSLDETLYLTINAGADMLIFANQWGEITATEVIDRIEALVEAKQIEKNRIEQAYQRILNLKNRLSFC